MVLNPVFSDVAAESAWDPRGAHLSDCPRHHLSPSPVFSPPALLSLTRGRAAAGGEEAGGPAGRGRRGGAAAGGGGGGGIMGRPSCPVCPDAAAARRRGCGRGCRRRGTARGRRRARWWEEEGGGRRATRTTAMEPPPLFQCPISMELMEDPVTVATGVTYDRRSMERWFFRYGKTTWASPCSRCRRQLPHLLSCLAPPTRRPPPHLPLPCPSEREEGEKTVEGERC
ncbi:Os02g0215650 [Oryza sativa Japonica Group]|uniref:U-box domain-containing protein n=1 Tax=Oryza sativa subsp. japonica TaxID=39947 RepID=A0A0P0VGD5_ORYSJ|nr:hypothetical protein EE612_009762 [Oryza sativa]BAS77636.1 Os02g0215650 [Oryza sativa Japonica Group]